MKRVQQHIHPLVLAGLVVLIIIALSVWLDSQDRGDAKKAHKIMPTRQR